ncbi:MAG TPA: hypothetical protein VK530_21530, partial [Candidatus Acidoferrum sp.]|nr:hypothetical protein [Candidatus Acidoferrum sp.]
EGAGAASAMRNAAGQTTYQAVTNGLATADSLLSENPVRLVDRMMVAGVDAVVSNLMSNLTSQWNIYKNLSPNQRAQFKNVATTIVGNHFIGGGSVTDTIRNRVRYFGVTGLPISGQLFNQLSSDISRVVGGINANANGFNGGPVGADAIRQLVALSASQYASAVAGPEVEAALSQIASAFNQLRTMMLNAQSTIAGFSNGLVGGSSSWKDELELLWNSQAPRFDLLTQAAAADVTDIVESFNWRVDDPFSGSGAAELKQRIRAEIADRLISEAAIAVVRNSIKYRLFDANANYRSAANSLFAQYNTVARNLISSSLVHVDNNFAPGLGILEQFFAISRVQGHAEIQDESLRELRIDGRFKIKVPDDMAFNAYLEIRELNSENTPEACLPANDDVVTEVKFGATDVELDWISDGLRADVGTKINLVGGNAIGFAGSLQTRGPLEFGGFVIKQVGFAMAFGELENYIAANARVKLGQSSEIAGGLFFGKACDLQPLTTAVIAVSPYLLTAVNPGELFGQPPFTGGFVYGEGMFPVFSLGCLFEVRIIAGAGAWFFTEGPRFGGIIKAGVSGTVLCVLTASGDVTLIGSKRDGGMTFVGMAHVEGCIGFWPLEFCIDGDTSVKYVEGREWDADEP